MPTTKIEVLKLLLNNLQPGSLGSDALKQLIIFHDNPLGILPGDNIEVWCGGNNTLVKRIFIRYHPKLSRPWETDNGGWEHAKVPTNIPELSPDDMLILNSVKCVDDIDVPWFMEFKKIMQRVPNAE